MTAPVEVRDQARALREQGKTYREIGERLGVHQSTALRWAPNLSAPDRLGPNRLAQDASGLVPDGRCRRDHKRERAETAARKTRALAELAARPADEPRESFARVYRAALADGVDLLEERDAIYELKCCGRLPVEGCVCVPVREEKAA